jgi:Zn-dependent peptidase ImmA (M78 family)
LLVDEFGAILRAREFVVRANQGSIPVRIEAYLEEVNCELKVDSTLPSDEPGYSLRIGERNIIVVNGNDLSERRRFTACHELGHIVLDLPSEHEGSPLLSYSRRPPNEVYCDVFAGELLLPYRIFKPLADSEAIGFRALNDLAARFEASVTATGSRFAAAVDAPCAFVLSEGGRVRYASRSKALRETGAWIAPSMLLPRGSLSEIARSGQKVDGEREIAADMWFSDWKRGGLLLEEARQLSQWDQTITLLWFEDDELPDVARDGEDDEEESGLKELDGTLPWPGKSRRRR